MCSANLRDINSRVKMRKDAFFADGLLFLATVVVFVIGDVIRKKPDCCHLMTPKTEVLLDK